MLLTLINELNETFKCESLKINFYSTLFGRRYHFPQTSPLPVQSASCYLVIVPPPASHHLFHQQPCHSSSGEFYFSYFIKEYFFIGSRLNWQSCNEMPFYCSSRSRHLPPSALSFHNTYTRMDTQPPLCTYKDTHTHTPTLYITHSKQ